MNPGEPGAVLVFFFWGGGANSNTGQCALTLFFGLPGVRLLAVFVRVRESMTH